MSDEALVRRGKAGDGRAFGVLVDRHHAAAYRVALSIVSDSDAAEDVAQDAFLKAFRSLDGFRGDAAFRTWLLTIVGNEARGALRRRARRRETALEDAGPLAAAGTPADEAALLAREAARARGALERLPEKQRMSVTLRIEEGLSFRDIGEITGSSEGAARVNYFHGIRKLREWLS